MFPAYLPAQLHLGRNYPLGYAYFRPRLHSAFMGKAGLIDENEIRQGIQRAEFVKREIEALYYLKKYRAMRERYGSGVRPEELEAIAEGAGASA